MTTAGGGGAVAFAASEFDPVTPGGIGRVVALLTEAVLAHTDDTVHLFLPDAVARACPARPRVERWAYDASSSSPLERSQALCRALTRVTEQLQGGLRWVEFPDFQGLGFAALQRGALVGFRGSPELRVRVHGPSSLIAFAEGEAFDATRLLEFDLERGALHLADLCLAPTGAVRDAVATFFRLDGAWRSGVRLHLPPRGAVGGAPPGAPGPRCVIFPTKLQAIKRPDLFVDALRLRPEAQPVIAAHRNAAVESALFAPLRRAERARFTFAAWDRAERARRLAGQVVVVPSDFETLSLAAWEAAAVGAHVVGSRRCPAFMEGPLPAWPGFVGFDGTPGDLARAIAFALSEPPPPPLVVPDELPPAERRRSPKPRVVREEDLTPVTGPVAQWATAVESATTPWVLLAAEDGAELRGFRRAATAALARDARLDLVASLGPGLASPSAQWLWPSAPAGAVVAPRELALRTLGGRRGARAVTATALQLGLRVAYDVEHRALAAAEEAPLPPPWLDAPAVVWRARAADHPTLKAALSRTARRRVAAAVERVRGALRRR